MGAPACSGCSFRLAAPEHDENPLELGNPLDFPNPGAAPTHAENPRELSPRTIPKPVAALTPGENPLERGNF